MGRKATYQELAEAVGVGDRSAVKELLQKGMPQQTDAAKAWYAAFIRGGSVDNPGLANDSSPYGRKLLAEAVGKEIDAEKKRLQLAQLRGELVERSAVAATLRKVVTAIKNRVELLADELAMLFPPDRRAAIITDVRESIRLALTELAALDDYIEDDRTG